MASLGTPAQQRFEEAQPDPRTSLRHVLANEPEPDVRAQDTATPVKSAPSSLPADEIEDGQEDGPSKASSVKGQAETPMYTATTTTVRRNANGSVSSVYSGNKIRHLKKDDGVPLWRKDIQYDFLRYVFEDTTPVFHKVSDGTYGHTFADIYLDAMAKSSKCSKILKDKLLTERASAINMAMVCLLVNVGRMNTTLNFFPEMRAQLRTYHSIPCLQAKQDPNAYKQLQDAPRLKSILKGATEDTEQPSTIEEIRAHPVPRTNPVNLIFVLAQYAPKISEIHFHPPRDFFDLVMRPTLSSRSRATAFMWLMWWYLESDFSEEAALNNPFGPGQYPPGSERKGVPVKCPPFEHLNEAQQALENVDTKDEQDFGEAKQKERVAILASDTAPVVTGPKRGTKKSYNNNPIFSVHSDDGTNTPTGDHQSPAPSSTQGHPRNGTKIKLQPTSKIALEYPSDTDRTRSASPSGSIGPGNNNHPPKSSPGMRINQLLNEDMSGTPAQATLSVKKGPGRGNWRRDRTAQTNAAKSKLENLDAPSPATGAGTLSHAPHGFYLPLNGAEPSHKRSRPLTAHQIAVERYRTERVRFILDRSIRELYRAEKRRREREGRVSRAWKRLKLLPDGYDSEEDTAGGMDDGFGVLTRFAGLVPCAAEENSWGEESAATARALKRASKKFQRDGGLIPVRAKRGDHILIEWVPPAEKEEAKAEEE
ncbi:hypothetical protein M501DRAFT_17874 [Patellaria atrata CBS 101060]|uniref:Ino eighty subunit 1 n=1 Tax=Patellaria atrata CBS 101060 TaxID=1346257 RepID=A0A9P4SHQ0_9PEZI|nr:hypothetical protein M501DRAFT_17874 [Patellaria atrata CBS 101060]